MKKNVKNSLLATLSLSAVCALCVGVSSVKNASAETQAPTADIVVAGAGVYVGGGTENGVDKSGIRFQVLAKKSLVESGAEIGALLLPADMTTATELEVDTVVIQNEEIEGTETVTNETLSAEKWTASSYTDYLQTYVYLYNFPVNDYNREILASAYIKSGENYIYSETVSRSMAYVALAAENEGDDRAVGYIKQYHVNYYGEDGETEISGLENVGVRYGSLIEKPADPVSATSNKVFAGWYADKACTEAFDFTKAVKGTTNVYSGWIDGYVFTKNGFQLFEDGVAAAGTGWTASAVLKGGNVPSSDLRLERGGIALKATYSSGIRRCIFTVGQFGKESGMYLGMVSSEWNQNDNSKAIKLADTYDYMEDITLTVANYNDVLYFKVETASGATYTATYTTASTDWTYSAYSANGVAGMYPTCNSYEQQIGVGGLEAASSIVTNVSYAVGETVALNAARAMGFTIEEKNSYTFSKNGFQLFEDGIAAAGTGWTASAVLKGGNVPSSDLRLERGGIALKATYSSGIRRCIFTVGQFGKESGMYLGMVSSEWNQNDNSKAIKLADTYDYMEDITLTIANYNDVLYFKVETASGATYTATYTTDSTDWTYSAYSANGVAGMYPTCNSYEQQIGVGGLEAASSTVSYVSYAVGNDKAKAAAEAMGFTVA